MDFYGAVTGVGRGSTRTANIHVEYRLPLQLAVVANSLSTSVVVRRRLSFVDIVGNTCDATLRDYEGSPRGRALRIAIVVIAFAYLQPSPHRGENPLCMEAKRSAESLPARARASMAVGYFARDFPEGHGASIEQAMLQLIQQMAESNAAVVRALKNQAEAVREMRSQGSQRGGVVDVRQADSLQGSREAIFRTWPTWCYTFKIWLGPKFPCGAEGAGVGKGPRVSGHQPDRRRDEGR